MNTPRARRPAAASSSRAPLKHDLRISGTPVVHLRASLEHDAEQPRGLARRLRRRAAGDAQRRRHRGNATADCWGERRPAPTTTAPATSRCASRRTAVTQWRVTKGILDSSNRTSLTSIEPLTIGATDRLPHPAAPEGLHVFAAGHQIGDHPGRRLHRLQLGRGHDRSDDHDGRQRSKVTLPVVGGARPRARRAGSPTRRRRCSTVPADITATATSAAGATVSYAGADGDRRPRTRARRSTCAPASGSAFAGRRDDRDLHGH